jgi:SAM-dependent methyltransferase
MTDRPASPPVCDYEGSDYQSRFWERGGRGYEDRVERIALQRLLPPRAARRGRFLEVGAGAGRLTREYDGYDEVVLLDYSRTLLQEARARLGAAAPGGRPRYTYVAANVYRMPFRPARFAGAAMVRVIHHMADVPAALAQVRRALAPGAPFVLEFASKRHLKSIARWLLRRQNWNPFAPEPVEFVKLNFDFDPAWMRARLSDAGLVPGRRLTVSHFRLSLFKRLVPTGLLVAADSLAQLTGDWWQLAPSVFVRCAAAPAPAGAPTGRDDAAAPGDLFACPVCGTPLGREVPPLGAGDSAALTCPACGQIGLLHDGLYDFRDDS